MGDNPSKPKSPTKPNAPASGETPPAGSPPAAPKTLDIARYRNAQRDAPDAPDEVAQERGPKVRFGDLAGLDGFRVGDPFDGVHPTYGHWWAVKVVAPDGATATALSNESSGPGSVIAAAVRNGQFDEPGVLVPVHVRLVESTKNVDPKTGKPFVRVLVTLG